MDDFSNIELPDGRRMRRTHRIVASHFTEQYKDDSPEMIFVAEKVKTLSEECRVKKESENG